MRLECPGKGFRHVLSLCLLRGIFWFLYKQIPLWYQVSFCGELSMSPRYLFILASCWSFLELILLHCYNISWTLTLNCSLTAWGMLKSCLATVEWKLIDHDDLTPVWMTWQWWISSLILLSCFMVLTWPELVFHCSRLHNCYLQDLLMFLTYISFDMRIETSVIECCM